MKKGFTLLELSIVLVIIGLIIGGITVGADLIRAAELNSIISQADKYRVAMHSFRLKYNSLPGDLPNAGSYWPNCDATPANCNGDGDSNIDYFNGTDTKTEFWRVWQQLADAEIITGSYTGVMGTGCSGSGGHCALPGVNLPEGTDANSLWIAAYLDIAFTAWSGSGLPRHVLAYSTPAANGRWYDSILTTQDAHNIDVKLDDGSPFSGTVTDIGPNVATLNCTTTQDRTDAEYNLTFDEKACLLFFDL